MRRWGFFCRLALVSLVLGFSILRGSPDIGAAAASYDNALIATTALKYVGQWGGRACADAHRSGFTGLTTGVPHNPTGFSASSPPSRSDPCLSSCRSDGSFG
jgi:hypothetical protein